MLKTQSIVLACLIALSCTTSQVFAPPPNLTAAEIEAIEAECREKRRAFENGENSTVGGGANAGFFNPGVDGDLLDRRARKLYQSCLMERGYSFVTLTPEERDAAAALRGSARDVYLSNNIARQ
ncbi:MAG: hypothetical protein AAF830_08595 [Pseudomonadota bacterium]